MYNLWTQILYSERNDLPELFSGSCKPCLCYGYPYFAELAIPNHFGGSQSLEKIRYIGCCKPFYLLYSQGKVWRDRTGIYMWRISIFAQFLILRLSGYRFIYEIVRKNILFPFISSSLTFVAIPEIKSNYNLTVLSLLILAAKTYLWDNYFLYCCLLECN